MNLDFKNMTDEQKANLKKQILEEEAKEIIEDENKLDDLFKEWLWETIETGYKVLKTDEETEEWKGLND
nr:MAG TPA: hypothetical protein [Caudoviricetes sp.]